MPKFNDSKEIEIKRAVRDALVIDPLISINKIRDYLFKKGFKTANDKPLNANYLGKLIKKIRRTAIKNVDVMKLNTRMVELKEKHRIVYERLARIIFYNKEMYESGIPPPTQMELMKALDMVMKWDIAVLEAEVNTGLLNKKDKDGNIITSGDSFTSNDLISLLRALPENEKIKAINTINEIILRARNARNEQDTGGIGAGMEHANDADGERVRNRETDNMAKNEISGDQVARHSQKRLCDGMARKESKDNT